MQNNISEIYSRIDAILLTTSIEHSILRNRRQELTKEIEKKLLATPRKGDAALVFSPKTRSAHTLDSFRLVGNFSTKNGKAKSSASLRSLCCEKVFDLDSLEQYLSAEELTLILTFQPRIDAIAAEAAWLLQIEDFLHRLGPCTKDWAALGRSKTFGFAPPPNSRLAALLFRFEASRANNQVGTSFRSADLDEC